jgi:hypothetical protein
MPGFNDTDKTDVEVLAMIANWLETTRMCVRLLAYSVPLLTTNRYKKNLTLYGIIYLHRISDNRMAGAPLKTLQMFGKLCGDGAIRNVVLATTMWTKVNSNLGERREQELKARYWQGMLNLGSRTMRFGDSFNSAWKIIDQIVDNHEDYPLLFQEELVDLGLQFNETVAGKTLYTKLQMVLAEKKEVAVKLRYEVEAEQNEQLARRELAKQYG